MSRAGRVVIVGASIAGLTTAETLRQEGFGGDILLIGEEPHLPYARPPMSKQVLHGDWEGHEATLRTERELADLDIRLRVGCRAVDLEIGPHLLHTDHGVISYDELVIATGTAPRSHDTVTSALTLRTLPDAIQLRERMSAAHRVAVIGSGVLGSEIASAARRHGAETLLIGRSATLGFGAAGDLLSNRLAALHHRHGVELALSAHIVSAITTPDGRTRLGFSDGTSRIVDLAVAAIGGDPQTHWLRSSGLDISNGVVCDAAGSAAPGIWAVGDVAAWTDPVSGRPTRVEHQSHAIEQAIAVGLRLQRGRRSAAPVPLFWSEIHGVRITAYGWFAPDEPLHDRSTDEEAPDRRILGSSDADGTLRGVIGWNASPRAFRGARAQVVTAPAPALPVGV